MPKEVEDDMKATNDNGENPIPVVASPISLHPVNQRARERVGVTTTTTTRHDSPYVMMILSFCMVARVIASHGHEGNRTRFLCSTQPHTEAYLWGRIADKKLMGRE